VTSNCLQGVYSQAFKPPYWLAYNKDVARHAETKVFNCARHVTCKTTHAIALEYMRKKRQMDRKKFQEYDLTSKQVTGAVRKQCGSFEEDSMNQATVLKVVDAFLARGVIHLIPFQLAIFKPSLRLPPPCDTPERDTPKFQHIDHSQLSVCVDLFGQSNEGL
jgi:hypothetical protein